MSTDGEAVGYIAKTTDRVTFAAEVMERYRGEVDAAGRIFVKPNIVSHELYPTTTHPDVLKVVLDHLHGKNVVVGDGVAVDVVRSHRTLVSHPLYHVCERAGVKVIDLHHTPSSVFKSPRGFSVTLSRTPFNFDLIISLPVLKSHPVCQITGALKNQFGFTTKGERIKLHSGLKNIHKAIAEINALRGEAIFIVDAVETLRGANEIRHGGRKTQLGYMLAGRDPVALDARGFELLATVEQKLWGKTPLDVRHLAFAAEYGVGSIEGPIEEI